MANYTKGPWDYHSDILMDISSNLGNAHDDLTHVGRLDQEMDTHQEHGYHALRESLRHIIISPTVKVLVERGLGHFHHAERIESDMETFVASGTDSVATSRD